MSNRDKILSYRDLIKKKLIPLINADYVLLDVPNHPNIGDNLIWEGELRFLEHIHYKCIYSANVHNWDENKIKDAKIILFHGGGNWGDLYRECQEHRLYIAEKFKDKRIIIFPQTVWYNNKSILPIDCKIFNNHADIHICLRDQMSMDILSNYVDAKKLYLLPDMAFFVDVEAMPMRKVRNDCILFMLRTDSEIDDITFKLESDFDVKDWPTFSNNKYILLLYSYFEYFKVVVSKRLQKCKFLNVFVSPIYGLNRKNNRERYIYKGINFFSNYEIIYTTRLHGLILGILMDKKVIIVDNKYNKCKNYYDTWLREFDNIELMS